MDMFWLIAIVTVYLSTVGYLGWLGYKRTSNALDYNLGGRNAHPYVLAMSYGATFISTSAIVGFGGLAAVYGMSLLWLTLCNIVVGIIIAFIFYGKRTRRMGLNLDVHTFPELLGKRVDSPFVQRFTGMVIFLFMPLYAAAVLIGASRLIESLVGVPYEYALVIFSVLVAAYVTFGGLKGVMYTDALQGTLMFAGMIFLFIFIYAKLGGVVTAHKALSAMESMVPENLQAIGHRGWTRGPEGGSVLWWVIYSSIVLGVGIGVLAQPQLVVRYMSVKSDKELNRAIGIGSVFILACTGTAFIVGSLSNVYFLETSGAIAIAAAEGNSDKIIPMFIGDAMPSWFSYLFLLVILSAGLSTLSSQFHTIGTSISRDFVSTFMKNKKEEGGMLATRLGILITILFSILLSFIFPPGIIARATAIFFGLMASSFLAPYTFALWWKKLTRKGAIAGILTGFGTACLLFVFVHGKEASALGISQALFGKPTLASGLLTVVDPLVFALPLSTLVTFTVSLFTKVENQATVDRAMAADAPRLKEESA